jgi:hypothetical protein
MRAPRSCCAKPQPCMKSARLRTIAARLCLLALATALAGGCAELLHGQAQQPANQAAKPDSAQSSSGQANSGQSGAQNGQPQQNSGASAGAPMVLGAGDGEEAPAEQAPAKTPASQSAPDQSGQPSDQPVNQPVDQPASAQGEQSPVPADATSLDPAVAAALAALPPGPPDSGDPRKVVDWECADLLKLATDLKVAVDKTTKDELSLSVVRKAGQIEQMAHKLRDMRPAVAGKE